MARVLIAAAAATGSAVASTTSQFAGTLFMLCMAAAVLGAAVFACGHRSKRNNQMRPNVTYYGKPGGGGGTGYAAGKQGRTGLGTGLAAGAAGGLDTAAAVDAAVSSAGCGGGGG